MSALVDIIGLDHTDLVVPNLGSKNPNPNLGSKNPNPHPIPTPTPTPTEEGPHLDGDIGGGGGGEEGGGAEGGGRGACGGSGSLIRAALLPAAEPLHLASHQLPLPASRHGRKNEQRRR